VNSADRVTCAPELPDVPGMNKSLPVSGIDMQASYGVMTTAEAPAAATARLHEALLQAVRVDGCRDRMQPQGFSPVWNESLEAFGRYLAAQEKVWRRLVEVSGGRCWTERTRGY
jgi:tripartite-type tricarboxylate transporter receptor subunit TctC